MMEQKQILLVGACGMGVGPLGIFLARMGYDVYGHDDYPVKHTVDRLVEAGITMLDHLHGKTDFDEVIVTRAIAYTPERLERFRQRYLGASIYFRGEYLAKLSNTFRSVVVAGSHGKTTTTAHLVGALACLGQPVSYILGGYFQGETMPAASYDRRSNWLVIEVDESDGTIEAFAPAVSVITNVELDHVDQYQSIGDLGAAFCRLMLATKEQVFLGPKVEGQVVSSWGGMRSEFEHVTWRCLERKEEDFLQENHRLATCVAEWMTGRCLRESGFESPAVERRQECQQVGDNCWVLTDYAHHPGEIQALGKWVKNRFPEAAIHWVFQPHRYSRTVALKKEFIAELGPLNPYILPEYGAFETVLEGGTAASLHAELRAWGSSAVYCANPIDLQKQLTLAHDASSSGVAAGTVFIFAGAGDILLWKDWFYHGLVNADGADPDDFLSTWLNFHEQHCPADGSRFFVNEPLKRKTTMNVGGEAKYYVEPASLEALQLVLKTSHLFDLPVYLLGKGSNLLVLDEGVDGVVVRMKHANWQRCEPLGDGKFWVGAGLSSKRMCKAALDAGVGGFNFLDGIPGSIGGAIRMNAGAMGAEIADRVLEVECLDYAGKRLLLTADELGFSYRNCQAVEGLIVLNVLLQGESECCRERLREELSAYRQKRLESQPADPSAGCMFKNPEGDSAGRLIDLAGLKGFTHGGASVSSKHGNFLITSKVTSSDEVEAVIAHVQMKVKEQFGIELKQEIKRFPPSIERFE